MFPIAQEESSISQMLSTLTDEESIEYQRLHNSILLLEETITPEVLMSNNKNSLGVKTEKYDTLGNSAGQDNVGQIIGALLSFKRLKNELKDEYRGGILLIDELDATLYPAAQLKLMETFYKYASKLNLQIIFTTHSLEIIEYALQVKYSRVTQLLYLSNISGSVDCNDSVDLEIIKNDLRVLANIEKSTTTKINLYTEDNEAMIFFKNLIKPSLRKNVNIINENFGGDFLLSLSQKKIPEFNNSIILLDGDKSTVGAKKNKKKNVIFLPGKESPERLIYAYLKKLSKDDQFWQELGKYTKQFCFKNEPALDDRESMKTWFITQYPYWGRGGAKFFNKWKDDNKSEVEKFEKNFEELLEYLKK